VSVQCKGCGEVSVSVSVRHVYSFFFNCILILLTSTIRGVYIKKVRKKSSYFFYVLLISPTPVYIKRHHT